MPMAKTTRLCPGMRAEAKYVQYPIDGGMSEYADVKLYLDGDDHAVMESKTGASPGEIRDAVLEYLDGAVAETTYAMGNLGRNRPGWEYGDFRSVWRNMRRLSGWHRLSVHRPRPDGPYLAILFGRSSRILFREDLPASIKNADAARAEATRLAGAYLSNALKWHLDARDRLKKSQPFN